MGITFDRTVYTGRRQAFWRGEAKMLPGGFKYLNHFNIGAVIKRGALVQVNFDNMTAGVVKVGQIMNGGTTTKPRVSKDNLFEIGDSLMKLDGTLLATVRDIDHSNSEYDVITLDKAYTGLATNDFIIEAAESGEGEEKTVAPLYTPNAVIGADKEIKKNGSETVDVAYEVLVIKSNVPPFPEKWIAEGGFHMTTNPNIRFIEQ